MRRSVKVGLTALTAAILLASAVTTASANRLSVSNQAFRATWTSLEFASEIVTIRCRVTLEGSFHTRTIAKVERSLIGAVSRAIVAHPCTNGEGWADNGSEVEPLGTAPNRLPFHVTFESIASALPNISTVNLLLSRVSFVISSGGGFGCTGRYGNATDNITGAAALVAGAVTTLEPVATRNRSTLVTRLGGIACPNQGEFRGTGNVTQLNSAARLTVTLI